MQLPFDLHTHTTFSRCGCHSLLEMLQYGIKKGLAGMAITDHGPTLGGNVPSTFYERFENPFHQEIHLFKGMECNFTKTPGKIDVPKRFLKNMDIVILGFHFNVERELGAARYTDMLLKALENNPFVNMVSHPIEHNYPIDYDTVAKYCAEKNIALELNNSKVALGHVTKEEQASFIEICLKHNTPMILNSDAHAVEEIGNHKHILKILGKMNVPKEKIINATLNGVLNFFKQEA